MRKTNHYPLEKICVVCGAPFVVRNGAEFRNTTCSTVCGNKKATATRNKQGHWNLGNPHGIRGEKHPFFGKHHSEKSIEANRLAHLGRPAWNKGIATSETSRAKMSERKKGKHLSPQTEFKRGLLPWNKGAKFPQFSGEKNPSWKGGITPELKRLRNSSDFKWWRESVFKRDNWTCQKCKTRGAYLHPHHIKNFSEYPELRFETSNGITLCKNCHTEFHTIYGKTENTSEQMSDFLKR